MMEVLKKAAFYKARVEKIKEDEKLKFESTPKCIQDEQLAVCYNKIEENSIEGLRCCRIDGKIHKTVNKDLNDKGFKINNSGEDLLYNPYFYIHW